MLLKTTSLHPGRSHRASSDTLSVVVPTRDSAGHIDVFLAYYRANDIPVHLFVDARTSDATAAIGRRHGAAVTIFRMQGAVVEEAIEAISKQAAGRWVLRIDDDELPSLAMMAFVRRAVATGDCPNYAFPRFQCGIGNDRSLLRNLAFSPLVHRQPRLYRKDAVEYTPSIHTPGFVRSDSSAAANAPISAFMIHLDWTVHSVEWRTRKIEQYDAVEPNGGSQWRDFYLIEENALAQLYFEALPTAEFVPVARALAARFPEALVRRPVAGMPSRWPLAKS